MNFHSLLNESEPNLYTKDWRWPETRRLMESTGGHFACASNGLPMERSSAGVWHFKHDSAYFQRWIKNDFFERLWLLDLQMYGEWEGIGWPWQSIDGSLVKVPLTLETAGKNPTDRGKGPREACWLTRAAAASSRH